MCLTDIDLNLFSTLHCISYVFCVLKKKVYETNLRILKGKTNDVKLMYIPNDSFKLLVEKLTKWNQPIQNSIKLWVPL